MIESFLFSELLRKSRSPKFILANLSPSGKLIKGVHIKQVKGTLSHWKSGRTACGSHTNAKEILSSHACWSILLRSHLCPQNSCADRDGEDPELWICELLKVKKTRYSEKENVSEAMGQTGNQTNKTMQLNRKLGVSEQARLSVGTPSNLIAPDVMFSNQWPALLVEFMTWDWLHIDWHTEEVCAVYLGLNTCQTHFWCKHTSAAAWSTPRRCQHRLLQGISWDDAWDYAPSKF